MRPAPPCHHILPSAKIVHRQMTIEYRVSEYLWGRYTYTIARRRGDPYSRPRFYWLAILPIVTSGLGTYSAFSALSNGGSLIFLFFGYILAIVTFMSIFNLRSYNRAVEDTYFPRHLDRDGVIARLDILPTGIREWQGDVALSANSSDIVSTDLDGDLLHISLKGLRRIVIPRSSFGLPNIDLESVCEMIKELRDSRRLLEATQIQEANKNR